MTVQTCSFNYNLYAGAPIIAFNNEILPNNSIIDLDSITTSGSIVNSISCIRDEYPCCNVDDKGGWILPSFIPSFLYHNYLSKIYLQAILLYRNGDVHVPNGIFTCQAKDNTNITHTLYVGIYLLGQG